MTLKNRFKNYISSGLFAIAFADLEAIQALKIEPKVYDKNLNVAVVELSEEQKQQVLNYNHDIGRCAGFEVIPQSNFFVDPADVLLENYRNRVEQDLKLSFVAYPRIQKDSAVESAISELKASNLKATVTSLSSYNQRNHQASNPNVHLTDLKQKVEAIIGGASFVEVSFIEHRSTRQKSLRLRLKGASKPDEIIVIGAHHDSINSGWGGDPKAPGADDNASGSANILETARVLLRKGQPARTVEFFWYAGEEGGLLGSGEIASQYKSSAKKVIAVLQLDMTLFPGSGELTIGNITDNTSPWLRDLLTQINSHYIGARIIEDTCGYGCSDHASWYRQGYPTLLPFESAFRRINSKIHTSQDVIDRGSNFNHSLVFSKIALAFAMHLGNSNLRQP